MKKRVRVISPSGKIAAAPADDLQRITQYLEKAGYAISFATDFDDTTDAAAINAFHDAFTDPDIDVVLCAWGGFNAIRLVGQLDYALLKRYAKPLVGFSDITVLLNAITTITGIKTYYGPLYWTFNHPYDAAYTLHYLQQALEAAEYGITAPESVINYMDAPLSSLRKNTYAVINPGEATGILTGGHIPTFNLLQGTVYFPDLAGKILMLEMNELDGMPVFERFLAALSLQKNFDQLQGILIGCFHSKSNIAPEQLMPLFRNMHIPVIANCPFGHVQPVATWPIGGRLRIDTSSTPILTVLPAT